MLKIASKEKRLGFNQMVDLLASEMEKCKDRKPAASPKISAFQDVIILKHCQANVPRPLPLQIRSRLTIRQVYDRKRYFTSRLTLLHLQQLRANLLNYDNPKRVYLKIYDGQLFVYDIKSKQKVESEQPQTSQMPVSANKSLQKRIKRGRYNVKKLQQEEPRQTEQAANLQWNRRTMHNLYQEQKRQIATLDKQNQQQISETFEKQPLDKQTLQTLQKQALQTFQKQLVDFGHQRYQTPPKQSSSCKNMLLRYLNKVEQVQSGSIDSGQFFNKWLKGEFTVKDQVASVLNVHVQACLVSLTFVLTSDFVELLNNVLHFKNSRIDLLYKHWAKNQAGKSWSAQEDLQILKKSSGLSQAEAARRLFLKRQIYFRWYGLI